MPTNFNSMMENAPASPEHPIKQYDSSYVLNNLDQAGLAMGVLGKAVDDYRADKQEAEDEYNFANVAAGLADIEQGVVRYNEHLAQLKAMTAGADEAQLKRVYEQFSLLQRGQIQGTMSPAAARLRALEQVKQASVAHPRIAKEVRLLANQSMGNYSEIAAEVEGSDPFMQQEFDTYKKARASGVTPAAYLIEQQAGLSATATKREVELAAAAGDLDKKAMSRGATNWYNASATLAGMQIVGDLERMFRNGETPDEKQIAMLFSNAKAGLRRSLAEMVDETIAATENKFVFGGEDFSSATKFGDEILDNLMTAMQGGDTLERKLANAKAAVELGEAEASLMVLSNRGEFGSYVQRLKDLIGTEQAGKFVTGLLATEAQKGKLEGLDLKAREALQLQAERLLTTGNSGEAYGILAYLNGDIPGIVKGQSLADYILGKPYKTGISVQDAETRYKGSRMFASLSTSDQDELAPNLFNNFTWNDLVKNQTMQDAVKRNDTLVAEAVGKATRHVIGFIEDTDPKSPNSIWFDANRPMNPFYYKEPVSIDSTRNAPILELNRTYQHILRMFGSDRAMEWVQTLHAAGVKEGGSAAGISGTLGVPKKKVSREDVAEPMSKVLDLNERKYGVPEAVVMAFGAKESSLGKNLQNPVSSASGPLGITKGTFKLMNRKYFNGELDWDNIDHKGEASLALIADLYKRHNGNLTKVALEYFSGRPDGWSVVDAQGTKAADYVSQFLRLVEQYERA